MQVSTYTLDGMPDADADLTQDAQGQLWLDGQLVLAVNWWGPKVALTLTRRLIFIDRAAYGRFTKYGGLLEGVQEE